MSIPPISGSPPYRGFGEDPPDMLSKLRYAWMANPTRETCNKLLDYIRTHHADFRDSADETAEFLDEKGLPFPEMPFEKAYKEAIATLQKWMDAGCHPNDISKEKTAVMRLAAWVSGGVCEE